MGRGVPEGRASAGVGWVGEYFPIALAYARAEIVRRGSVPTADPFRQARALGIELHPFKRLDNPRVRTALGMIRSLGPTSLLDIGSGRGLLLWPLAETLPDLRVVALDRQARSVERLGRAFTDGGLVTWRAAVADAVALPLGDDSVECASAFEVLEHIGDHERAFTELWRVARRAVVLSVPRKPDGRPGHLRYFDRAMLERMLGAAAVPAGAAKIMADRDRFFVLARKRG